MTGPNPLKLEFVTWLTGSEVDYMAAYAAEAHQSSTRRRATRS